MKNTRFLLLALAALAIPAWLVLSRVGGVTGAGVIEENQINLSFPALESPGGSLTAKPAGGRQKGAVDSAKPPAPLGQVKLYVDEGQKVVRGRILARIENETYSTALRRDRMTVKRAEATLAIAEERGSELNDKKAQLRQGVNQMKAARPQLEAKIAEIEGQLAQVDQGKKKQMTAMLAGLKGKAAELSGKLEAARQGRERLGAAQERLDQAKTGAALQLELARAAVERSLFRWRRTVIRAPRAGTVVALESETGEVAFPGQTVLKLGTGVFDLKLFLEPAVAARARPGARAKVFIDAYPGRPLEAKIKRLVPRVEPAPTNLASESVRLFDVRAVILRVRDRGGILKAGLPADAVIE